MALNLEIGIKNEGAEEMEDSTFTIEYRIQIQKEIGKELIQILAKYDMDVLLAGGAPREWYFNRPAKDLDFFLRDSSKSFRDCLFRDLENYGYQKEFFSIISPKDYEKEDIKDVLNFHKNGVKIQLIFIDLTIAPRIYVKSFDYDLCKIYYDESWREERWSQFNRDVENKTITLNLPSSKIEKYNAGKRFERMTQLFPDFKFRLV